MLTSRIIAALLLSFTITTNADGQIGGLIKRTVKEATKPKEEKDAKAAATPDTPPFPYELNEASMASFKRGLELEVQVREDYKNRLAKLKTPEQYQACTSAAAASPEFQKVMEEYATRVGGARTPDESQKAVAWFNESIAALSTKRCGDDPQKLKSEQASIFRKAEEAAAIEFAKGWTKPSRPDASGDSTSDQPNDCLEGDDDTSSMPMHLLAECTAVVIPQQGTSAETEEKVKWFRETKELLEKYCSLSPEMRADAQQRGISVPGTGNNIYWVFSKRFAIWVGDDCDHLMKLFSYVQ
jgi:hypothetical protein